MARANDIEFSITLGDARERFRARPFEQKGLSSTMIAGAGDQITGIAAAEEIDRRHRIESNISAAKRELTTALQQTVSYWTKKQAHEKAAQDLLDLDAQLVTLAEKLEDAGVSEEDLAVLRTAPDYAQVRKFCTWAKDEFSKSREGLGEVISAAFKPLDEELPEDIPTVLEFRANARKLKDDFSALMTVAGQVLERLEDLRSSAAASLEERFVTFKDQLDRANEAQRAHALLLSENRRLTAARSEALQEEIIARQAAEAAAPAVAKLAEARDTLARHIDEHSTILGEATRKVQDYSSGSLIARAKREACPPEYMSAVRALIEGAGIQDAADKATAWITSLTPTGWTEVCDGVLGFYERKVMLSSPPSRVGI